MMWKVMTTSSWRGALEMSFQALRKLQSVSFFFFITFHSTNLKSDSTCDARCSCVTNQALDVFFAFQIHHRSSQQQTVPALLSLSLSFFFHPTNNKRVLFCQLYLNSTFHWSNPSHSHFQQSNPPTGPLTHLSSSSAPTFLLTTDLL